MFDSMLGVGVGRRHGSGQRFREYIWRGLNWSQMDFQFASHQMIDLCRAPSDAYVRTKMQQEIKHQWARDDPAFVLLMIYLITASSFAYWLTFGSSSLYHFFRICFGIAIVEFLGLGCLIATGFQWYANKYLRANAGGRFRSDFGGSGAGVLAGLLGGASQLEAGRGGAANGGGGATGGGGGSNSGRVEWLYAFDVHCNSFFPCFVALFVLQFFLTPVLLADSFFSMLLSNALFAVVCCYYCYVTWLGYSALPFLKNTQNFLLPAFPLVLLFLICIICRWNVAMAILNLYFGH